jgi:hypothetical protein
MGISVDSDVEALGRTCGLPHCDLTSAQFSVLAELVTIVDDKFLGVSWRVARSGVLCCVEGPKRLTPG